VKDSAPEFPLWPHVAQAHGLFDRATRRTRAASASSPTSRDASRTRSSKSDCDPLAISSTAARLALTARRDGGGILVQNATQFFPGQGGANSASSCRSRAITRSVRCSLPHDPEWRKVIRCFAEKVPQEGLTLLGWREGAARHSSLGESVKPTEPFPHAGVHRARTSITSEDDFERKPNNPAQGHLRRDVSQARPAPCEYYVVSLSCRTLIYKGMFLADQIASTTPICMSRTSRPRSRWCISASRPHVPDWPLGAPVPHGRAQWRDQHAAWQRQLDGGAAGFGVVEALRRRHQEALADLV